jgi:autotransporter-associated beta strand protein
MVRTAQASPPAAGYDLQFADEFGGNSLDTLKWNYNYTWGRTHNHRAYMRESQVIVAGGVLNLQAIAQRDPSAPPGIQRDDFGWQSLDYTSGAINTSGKLNLTSGYIEASMKMDNTVGSWPAFWTAAVSGAWPPEIDIMEFPLGAPSLTANQYFLDYHYSGGANQQKSGGPNLTSGFHTYAVDWSSTAMDFYFDGTRVRHITDQAQIAQASSMYLILNHAVGGWSGTPAANSEFPVDFQIDWVRVWQKRTAGAVTTSTWNVNGSGTWDAAASWTGGGVPLLGGQAIRFGKVGSATVALVTWAGSRAVGGITFEGGAAGTTRYGIGAAGSTAALLFAGSGGNSNAYIEALSTSTLDQIINARMELWTNVDIRNHMATAAINLNGVIFGAGGLSIDGTAPVVFNSTNSYTGGTTIDAGAAGPAIARVTRLGTLGTGNIRIGPVGNESTARLELRDGAKLTNAIDFSGRNNGSDGIRNLTGDNELSGTIQLQVGGSQYLIQSDAGTLTLSGATAIRSAATGDRTLTLGGAGDGVVSGGIQNGAASALHLVKAGAGRWTLGGAAVHTGETRVEGGTLLLSGTAASSSGIVVGTPGTTASPRVEFVGSKTVTTLTIHGNSAAAIIPGAHSTLTVTNDAGIAFTSNEARLDLSDGGIILDRSALATTPAADVRARLLAGNLISSIASNGTAIGYRDSAAAGETFLGTAVDGSALLVRLTLSGDTTLNGAVDFQDLVSLAQHYNQTNTFWIDGDFNYDGITDFTDLVSLAQNYGQALSTGQLAAVGEDFGADFALALSLVPEPSVMMLAASGVVTLGRRQRTVAARA